MHAESARRFNRGRKPTIDLQEFADRMNALPVKFPRLYAIWSGADFDPGFREELMLAVAWQNQAPYCTWAHRTWAETAGASRAELAKIEQPNPDGLDRRKRAAVRYVRCLASSGFAPVPRELRREMESHYTPREIEDMEHVARVMDLVNRSANTYEAMLSRLQHNAHDDTRLLDEMVFSALFMAAAPLIVLLLSRNSGRSFLGTTLSLIDHMQRVYAHEA